MAVAAPCPDPAFRQEISSRPPRDCPVAAGEHHREDGAVRIGRSPVCSAAGRGGIAFLEGLAAGGQRGLGPDATGAWKASRADDLSRAAGRAWWFPTSFSSSAKPKCSAVNSLSMPARKSSHLSTISSYSAVLAVGRRRARRTRRAGWRARHQHRGADDSMISWRSFRSARPRKPPAARRPSSCRYTAPSLELPPDRCPQPGRF